jgi:hypothetical protein
MHPLRAMKRGTFFNVRYRTNFLKEQSPQRMVDDRRPWLRTWGLRMREEWKPAAGWQVDHDPGSPYQQRLVIGNWHCSVRTEPQKQGYVWAVKRKAWFGDWQHDGGFCLSLAEAMYQAEAALKRVAGAAVTLGT